MCRQQLSISDIIHTMTTPPDTTPWSPLGSRPMKIIFIAGPYIGDGKIETIEANIRDAEGLRHCPGQRRHRLLLPASAHPPLWHQSPSRRDVLSRPGFSFPHPRRRRALHTQLAYLQWRQARAGLGHRQRIAVVLPGVTPRN